MRERDNICKYLDMLFTTCKQQYVECNAKKYHREEMTELIHKIVNAPEFV